jgi:hypothetical protein
MCNYAYDTHLRTMIAELASDYNGQMSELHLHKKAET